MKTVTLPNNIDSLIKKIFEEINNFNSSERGIALEYIIQSLVKERQITQEQVEKLCLTSPTTIPDRVKKIFQYAFEHNLEMCLTAVESAILNHTDFSCDKSRIVKLIGQLNKNVADDLAQKYVGCALIINGHETYF